MDTTAFIALNGPIFLTAILANIFFSFPLFCSRGQNETFKQPLNVLFISVVTSNIFLETATFLYIFVDFFPTFLKVSVVIAFVIQCTAYSNMLTCMWLSIFYYTRIVPPRQAFFVWIKRKIKTIVYCGLIVNTVFILVLSTANLPRMIHDMMNSFTENSLNTTNGLEVNPAVSWIIQVSGGLYICFFSVTMALSWGATLVYLCRHMKRMQLSGSQSSSSRLRSQIRVTIMGIIQTALSFFFLFIAFLHWCYLYKYDRNNYVTVTMCSFFSTSTTVNLGLGQSVFRKRVANLFSKVFPSVRK